MKKTISLILIAIFTLTLGGCQKPKLTEKISQPMSKITGKTEESQKEVHSDWQVFENENHKFSFQYPSNWKLVPEIDEATLLTLFLQKEDSTQEKTTSWTGEQIVPFYQISVRVEENPENLSAKDFELKRYLDESKEEIAKGLEDTTIAGVRGFKEKGPITPPGSGDRTSISLAPDNSKVYSFTYTADAHKETHEKFLPEFTEILETLRFAD